MRHTRWGGVGRRAGGGRRHQSAGRRDELRTAARRTAQTWASRWHRARVVGSDRTCSTHLMETARARGVTNLQADVLVENRRMLPWSGHGATRQPTTPSARRSCASSWGPQDAPPPWPGPRRQPRVLVEASGGRWHGEAPPARLGSRSSSALARPPTRTARRSPASPAPWPRTRTWSWMPSPPTPRTGGRCSRPIDRVHAGVPICVELPAGSTPSESRPGLPAHADDRAVVAVLQRLARKEPAP